jgi:hypothetical protein
MAKMVDELTVVPAVFSDSSRALAELVEAKRQLDLANLRLKERERANVQMLSDPHWHGKRDEAVDHGARLLPPFLVEVERSRAAFDIAFSIYQEAARARDAKAANELAESNNATALASTKAAARIAWLTGVLALAAIAQAALTLLENSRTWSPHQ